MRSLLSWLLVFGVIAGLWGRVLELNHVHPKDHATECCGHDHDADDDGHTPDCPPGPHDHSTHACCHPAPLAGAGVLQVQRLLEPDSVRLGVTQWATSPPESPVFELDKPPLI